MSRTLRIEQIPSAALGRSQPVAILPPDRLDERGRCCLLLLLHGMGGSHLSWPSNTQIDDLTADLPLLVVMPSAENSFYLDSPVAAMETFICRELMGWLGREYPIIDTASGRGITGLSMGGYGALLLALRNPDLFGSATSHSGALLTARATTEVGVRWELADTLYGVGSSGQEKRREHDILTLAQGFVGVDKVTGAVSYAGPSIYIDCGADDFLYYASREVTQAMRMLHIPYEYHEWPGDHDWTYWNARLPDSLQFHLRRFGLRG